MLFRRFFVHGLLLVSRLPAKLQARAYRPSPHGQLSAEWESDDYRSLPSLYDFYNYTLLDAEDDPEQDKPNQDEPNRHEPSQDKAGQEQTPAPPENWKVFAEKGLKNWNRWLENSGPDVAPPEPVDQFMKVKTQKQPILNPTTEELIKLVGKSSARKKYVEISASWENPNNGPPKEPGERPEGSAHFACQASASQNILIVFDIDRGALPSIWHSSQPVWWMWERTLRFRLPHAANLPHSRLDYIFQQHVENKESKPILHYALSLRGAQLKETVIFRPGSKTHPDPDLKNVDLDNPFWVILGTPNGAAVINMLIDHKIAMKQKGIKMLALHWWKSENDEGKLEDAYTWWVDLKDAAYCLGDRYPSKDDNCNSRDVSGNGNGGGDENGDGDGNDGKGRKERTGSGSRKRPRPGSHGEGGTDGGPRKRPRPDDDGDGGRDGDPHELPRPCDDGEGGTEYDHRKRPRPQDDDDDDGERGRDDGPRKRPRPDGDDGDDRGSGKHPQPDPEANA